jgi:hypothetical protein
VTWLWQERFRWGYEDDETTERDAVSSATAGKQEKQRRRAPKGVVASMHPGAPVVDRPSQGRLLGVKSKSDGKARQATAQTHLLSFEQDE